MNGRSENSKKGRIKRRKEKIKGLTQKEAAGGELKRKRRGGRKGGEGKNS